MTHVPMFAPKIKPIPDSSGINPWLAKTMTIPVVADELWTIAVKIIPIKMLSIGFCMFCMARSKASMRLGAWWKKGIVSWSRGAGRLARCS